MSSQSETVGGMPNHVIFEIRRTSSGEMCLLQCAVDPDSIALSSVGSKKSYRHVFV